MSKINDETLNQYLKIIELHPEIEKKGKNNPYTSVNGHMFSFLNKEDGAMAVRLSKEDYEAFQEEYNVGPTMSHGAVMRGYVTLPKEIFDHTEKAADYLKMSYDHISSLPPKPTTKKKKS